MQKLAFQGGVDARSKDAVVVRVAGYAVFLVGSGLSPSASHGQEKTEPPKELEVSYEAFDQRPSSGWRKIADEGKYLEAARLIDRYEQGKEGP
ncbi:MAG: hypothetical protein ACREYC_12875 [Gammaproteobacteria bacterium]